MTCASWKEDVKRMGEQNNTSYSVLILYFFVGTGLAKKKEKEKLERRVVPTQHAKRPSSFSSSSNINPTMPTRTASHPINIFR